MFSSEASAMVITSCLLTVLASLVLACKTPCPEDAKNPIQVVVEPDHSKRAGPGDLYVTIRNRSKSDLLFRSWDLPWEFNGGGIDFVLRREDGSVLPRKPMIADPVVGRPTLLKRGKQLSEPMSLLVYYFDLPDELALHNVNVTWSYLPRPADLTSTNILKGEFLLRKTARPR